MITKKTVVSLVLFAVSAPAFCANAGSADIDRLAACTDVKDARERLACFDRESAPLGKNKADRPAPAAVPAPAPAPASTPHAPVPVPVPKTTRPAEAAPSFGEEQLGANSRPAASEKELVLHASIASLRQVNTVAWLVTLDNGQAWRHEDATLGGYLKEGEAVTIRKAALGTYRLTRDAGASKNWIRVTRVR